MFNFFVIWQLRYFSHCFKKQLAVVFECQILEIAEITVASPYD